MFMGKMRLGYLLKKFYVLFIVNGFEVEKIEREQDDVKEMVVIIGLKGINYIDVWAKLFISLRKEVFSNILYFVEIVLVVFVSSVFFERMFLIMNRVYINWRNCLGEKRVENLLGGRYYCR